MGCLVPLADLYSKPDPTPRPFIALKPMAMPVRILTGRLLHPRARAADSLI